MKRSVLLLVVSLAILISLVAALAATDSETPNDPRVNPNANACYTGGSMEGKCKLDEELWIAGWYAIRLQYNLIDSNQVPVQYQWILPPISDTNNAADVTGEPTGSAPTAPSNPSTPIPTSELLTATPTNLPTITPEPTREFPTSPPKPATVTSIPTLSATPITPTSTPIPTLTRTIPTPTFTAGPPPTVTALPH